MGARRPWYIVLTGVVVSAIAGPAIAAADCDGRRDKAALAAAVKLVPDGSRLTVKVIDPEVTGSPSSVRTLDAFVVREQDGSLRQVVYLNCDSAMFRAAAGGSVLHTRLVAAVIFHERCHLQGMDEQQAGAAERGFVAGMIQRGLIPQREGLAYLRLMSHASGVR